DSKNLKMFGIIVFHCLNRRDEVPYDPAGIWFLHKQPRLLGGPSYRRVPEIGFFWVMEHELDRTCPMIILIQVYHLCCKERTPILHFIYGHDLAQWNLIFTIRRSVGS